jgi:CubicO group peptidase (beta-lactamase class C family)
MAHLRPARELREDWSYVNLVGHLLRPSTAHVDRILQFYMLTSEIVARYSGQPFADFVSARIFSPVSMPASTYDFTAGEAAGTAVHWFTRAGRRLPPWITEADVAVAGAGGVVSSTQDLSRWLAFLLGYGDTHAKHALPAAVVEEAMSPQALMRGYDKLMNLSSTVTYGFGWGQRMHQGHRVRIRARAAQRNVCLCRIHTGTRS